MRWLLPLLVLALPVAAQQAPAMRPAQRFTEHAQLQARATSYQQLLKLSSQSEGYRQTFALKPQVIPTSDGRSFALVWKPDGETPQHWLVALAGTSGLATREMSVWHPHVKGRGIGLVTLQWWLGRSNATSDYYTPEQVYAELARVMEQIGAKPESNILQGFSRGSANIYAWAALDRTQHRYFNAYIASSGAMAANYPPNRAIEQGVYGTMPYASSTWVTAAGANDPNPERDGIEAMRKTAEWLKAKGATVAVQIEDPTGGHGALVTNPANIRRVLNTLLAH